MSTDGSGNPTAFTITNTNGDIVTATMDTGPGTPSYTAPPEDEAGFLVGENGVGLDGCGSTCLFASYPAFSGENPTDFFCDFSETNGALTLDSDAGFCPSTAVFSGSTSGTSVVGSGTWTEMDESAPEPVSAMLLGSGLIGLAGFYRLRTRRQAR